MFFRFVKAVAFYTPYVLDGWNAHVNVDVDEFVRWVKQLLVPTAKPV